jgi:hypothetical protein
MYRKCSSGYGPGPALEPKKNQPSLPRCQRVLRGSETRTGDSGWGGCRLVLTETGCPSPWRTSPRLGTAGQGAPAGRNATRSRYTCIGRRRKCRARPDRVRHSRRTPIQRGRARLCSSLPTATASAGLPAANSRAAWAIHLAVRRPPIPKMERRSAGSARRGSPVPGRRSRDPAAERPRRCHRYGQTRPAGFRCAAAQQSRAAIRPGLRRVTSVVGSDKGRQLGRIVVWR